MGQRGQFTLVLRGKQRRNAGLGIRLRAFLPELVPLLHAGRYRYMNAILAETAEGCSSLGGFLRAMLAGPARLN